METFFCEDCDKSTGGCWRHATILYSGTLTQIETSQINMIVLLKQKIEELEKRIQTLENGRS